MSILAIAGSILVLLALAGANLIVENTSPDELNNMGIVTKL